MKKCVFFATLIVAGNCFAADYYWRVPRPPSGVAGPWSPTKEEACSVVFDYWNTALSEDSKVDFRIYPEGWISQCVVDIYRNGVPYNTLRYDMEGKGGRVELFGPDYTSALPLGPLISLTAKLTRNGVAVYDSFVEVKMGEQRILKRTDLDGEINFTYTPPYFESASVEIFATCGGCSISDTKVIDVVAVDLGDSDIFPEEFIFGQDPLVQQCRR